MTVREKRKEGEKNKRRKKTKKKIRGKERKKGKKGEKSTDLGINGKESQIYMQGYVEDYTCYRYKKKDLL